MAASMYLIMAIAILLSGYLWEQRTRNTIVRTDTQMTGQSSYVAYKSAVQSYVFAHRSFEGSVSLSALQGADLASDAALMGNQILHDATGTTIVTWAPNTNNALAQALSSSEGNLTIGLSSGTEWATPSAGDMGKLPVSVPAGDVVSCVTFRGDGF